ncbi:MAG: CooT family nickel-binding protein [Thermoplasmata archaeon]
MRERKYRLAPPVSVMCESSVYLLRGGQRALVMAEAARVLVSGSTIVCIDTLGDRKIIERAELVEANLLRHEILLRSREE